MLAELAGLTNGKVAAALNERNVPTSEGGRWHAVTVKRVLARLA